MRNSLFYTLIYSTSQLSYWVECSSMTWETGVQPQVESYQRLKKWYLISPCLTLSIIRFVSRIKWSNPRKGVTLFPTIVGIEKETFGLPLTTVVNFTYFTILRLVSYSGLYSHCFDCCTLQPSSGVSI